MFVRLKTTPNSTKTAIQLVSNQRFGKKVKQKIIRHFGYAINDFEIEALKKIAEHYKEELLTKNAPPALIPKESLKDKILKGAENSDEDTDPINVNIKKIKEKSRFNVGIERAYGKIYKNIGFDSVISNPSQRKVSIKALFNIVMSRILDPLSKRGTVNMIKKEFGVKLNLNTVYKMMDLIDDKAIEKAKKIAFDYTQGLFKDPLNVVFYDCTTLYFESFIEDDLKQNGFSKDGKFNQCQVLLAMMVTTSGLPVGYELFEGSKFEGHTLDTALKQLHEKYAIKKVIFIADSAILNKENIERFCTSKQDFIVGARIKNLNKETTEKITNSKNFKPLHENSKDNDITLYETTLENGLRLIVTYSKNRAKKDEQDRLDAIKNFKSKLEKNKNTKEFISNSGYKKFIKINGKSKIEIDEDKIKEASKWDGLHGVITNLDKTHKPDYILENYKGLWQIEDTFRLSKHDAKIRPIFHWTEKRIKAHIAICYMVLTCMRVMEYKVGLKYKKMSSNAIKIELKTLQLSLLKDIITKKMYILPSEISQEAEKILKILELKWTDTPYEIK